MDSRISKDEIDLTETAIKTVRFLIKNLIWVILFLLAGLASGLLWSNLKKPIYEARMMLRASMVDEEEMTFLLQNYEKTGIPGLTPNQQNDNLKNFQFKVYAKENSVFCRITCRVNDTLMFSKIEQGIRKQLDREKLIQTYYEIFQTYNTKLVREYTDKIRRAEELIAQRNNAESVQGFPEIMNLYTRRAEFEAHLKNESIIKLVSGFHRPMPINSGYSRGIRLGLILGALGAFLFLFLKSFIEMYKKATNEPR